MATTFELRSPKGNRKGMYTPAEMDARSKQREENNRLQAEKKKEGEEHLLKLINDLQPMKGMTPPDQKEFLLHLVNGNTNEKWKHHNIHDIIHSHISHPKNVQLRDEGMVPVYTGLIDLLDKEQTDKVLKLNAEGPIPEGIFAKETIELLQFQSESGCEDASTYHQDIADKAPFYGKSQVINRRWCNLMKPEHDKISEALIACTQLSMSSDITLEKYIEVSVNVHKVTQEAANGICTTFAWAAAGILFAAIGKGILTKVDRMEVVGYGGGKRGGHVYVILNREGDFRPEKGEEGILLQELWNNDCIIVDSWWGTLGHPYIFTYEKRNGSFDGYTSYVHKKFDSNDYENFWEDVPKIMEKLNAANPASFAGSLSVGSGSTERRNAKNYGQSNQVEVANAIEGLRDAVDTLSRAYNKTTTINDETKKNYYC